MSPSDSHGDHTALVVGATSDIGRAITLSLAANMRRVHIAGRDVEQLEREALDLRIRTDAEVTVHRCDVLQLNATASLMTTMDPLPDVAVCVVGALGDQRTTERDMQAASDIMAVNYVGPATLLGTLAERFATRGTGVLVGVGSVAGDRGRKSNYVYGSAKAGLAAFLSGLRNRLANAGVHVVTVKPGFVRTRMTAGMDLPAWLTAEPGDVADAIMKAVGARRDVVYVLRLWRPLMWVMRLIPESAFKRLSL